MLKKVLFAVLLLNVVTAHAALIAKDLPQEKPPYGAYELDVVRWPIERIFATQDQVARHYGFADRKQAAAACFKVRSDCVDVVHHLRDESAKEELVKYGFKNWDAAVRGCGQKIQRGDIAHCDVDPFLKLRLKK